MFRVTESTCCILMLGLTFSRSSSPWLNALSSCNVTGWIHNRWTGVPSGGLVVLTSFCGVDFVERNPSTSREKNSLNIEASLFLHTLCCYVWFIAAIQSVQTLAAQKWSDEKCTGEMHSMTSSQYGSPLLISNLSILNGSEGEGSAKSGQPLAFNSWWSGKDKLDYRSCCFNFNLLF